MRNNLSPESAPWGREVDRRLSSVEGTLATLNQDSTNAFKSIAASLAQLSSQVSAVQTAISQSDTVLTALSRATTTVYTSTESLYLTIPETTTGDVFKSVITETITVPPKCYVLATYATGNAVSILGGGSNTSDQVNTGLRLRVNQGTGIREVDGRVWISQLLPAASSNKEVSSGLTATARVGVTSETRDRKSVV